MTTLAIVDDHAIFRMGLKYALTLAKDIQLVAEGEGADDAVRIAREIKPDVMLLDVRMPGEDGVAGLRRLLEENESQRVIMLTTSDTEEDIFQAVKAGAMGYILKGAKPESLIDAIRRVAADEMAFPKEVWDVYKMRSEMRSVSPREKEVLELIAKGCSNQEIATMLAISPNSIKIHLKHIFEKLDVVDRAEAVATALRRGVIQS